MSKPLKWAGPIPTACDICGTPITSIFIDGKTKSGPWGFMCVSCHHFDGCGLGVGRGQRFEKQADGSFLKVQHEQLRSKPQTPAPVAPTVPSGAVGADQPQGPVDQSPGVGAPHA